MYKEQALDCNIVRYYSQFTLLSERIYQINLHIIL